MQFAELTEFNLNHLGSYLLYNGFKESMKEYRYFTTDGGAIDIQPLSSPEEAKVKELIEKLISLMGLELNVYVEERENDFFVNVTGTDAALFIGKHGDSIEEFQTIVNNIYNKNKPRDEMKRITVDSNNYVEKRQQTLTNLAKRIVHSPTFHG